MAAKFGFLSKFEFLQDWASSLIARVDPAIVHNLEKYHALRKVFYLSTIEDVEGDYLEFGVFTGSSFCHSIRCCKRLAKLNKKIMNTKFYGFDSFAGFGDLEEDEKHPFYTDENFTTSLPIVKRRVQRIASNDQFKLIAGFFGDTLKTGAISLGIKKSRIIFIDSDTYSSANEALNFCIPTIQEGTFIVLDDYYSYRGSENRGVTRAFNEFVTQSRIKVRQVFSYGMGGVVYVVSERSESMIQIDCA
jgi:O-methyltransferase